MAFFFGGCHFSYGVIEMGVLKQKVVVNMEGKYPFESKSDTLPVEIM